MHYTLTDEQLAAIAWADPSETTSALAQRIAVSYNTVYNARRRMRGLLRNGQLREWLYPGRRQRLAERRYRDLLHVLCRQSSCWLPVFFSGRRHRYV